VVGVEDEHAHAAELGAVKDARRRDVEEVLLIAARTRGGQANGKREKKAECSRRHDARGFIELS
jgi:hypothetical protein